MYSLEEILVILRQKARPDQLEGMARFGIRGKKRLGVSIPDLRILARSIGKNHELALQLWDSGIEDARILASLVEEPERVSEKQIEKWVKGFNSWDVCDQVCMNLFDRVAGIRIKVVEWAQREEEFVRRAAFSLMAIICVHDKKAPDEVFVAFFPLIKQAALDERNYVKKAVSWALRNIGKRNLILNQEAKIVARKIQHQDTKSSRWIASDVLRELRKEGVQKALRKKTR
jgi:3-methyladenine DNA glycosylase AlkD